MFQDESSNFSKEALHYRIIGCFEIIANFFNILFTSFENWAKHPVTRNRQQLSRATIDENRVEISQLGRARTCRIRLTRLAGSSTTRTEMPNYWEDPEATASSPIPIAPIRPSKRSRRSRPPREERDISTTLISPNFGEPSPSIDRFPSVDDVCRWSVQDFLWKNIYYTWCKRRIDRSRSWYTFSLHFSDITRVRKRVYGRAWLYRKRIYYGGVWTRGVGDGGTVLSKFRCKWELPWKGSMYFNHPNLPSYDIIGNKRAFYNCKPDSLNLD